jgi:hypothetical protein
MFVEWSAFQRLQKRVEALEQQAGGKGEAPQEETLSQVLSQTVAAGFFDALAKHRAPKSDKEER